MYVSRHKRSERMHLEPECPLALLGELHGGSPSGALVELRNAESIHTIIRFLCSNLFSVLDILTYLCIYLFYYNYKNIYLISLNTVMNNLSLNILKYTSSHGAALRSSRRREGERCLVLTLLPVTQHIPHFLLTAEMAKPHEARFTHFPPRTSATTSPREEV